MRRLAEFAITGVIGLAGFALLSALNVHCSSTAQWFVVFVLVVAAWIPISNASPYFAVPSESVDRGAPVVRMVVVGVSLLVVGLLLVSVGLPVVGVILIGIAALVGVIGPVAYAWLR